MMIRKTWWYLLKTRLKCEIEILKLMIKKRRYIKYTGDMSIEVLAILFNERLPDEKFRLQVEISIWCVYGDNVKDWVDDLESNFEYDEYLPSNLYCLKRYLGILDKERIKRNNTIDLILK